jgi:hypothetical protein
MSLGNAAFGDFIVGRMYRLPSNNLPTQARRSRYIQKSKSKMLLVLAGPATPPMFMPLGGFFEPSGKPK